jgi:hypothetical protein
MVVMRITVLCGCGLALGGCLSPVAHTGSYTALPPVVVSDATSLPPVTEPGQLLNRDLGRTSAGVNPSDDLRSSERARVAWSPLHPNDLVSPPSFAAHTASGGMASNPAHTVSTTQPSKIGGRRAAQAQSYDPEKAMDRLERDGRRDAKPICSDC